MTFLQGLFRPAAEREASARDAAIADPLIDRMVAASDKRLALMKALRASLREPVMEARARLEAMIGRIPGAFEVSPRSWGHDDTIRVLFARAEDAAGAFSNDANAREYFDLHPSSDCVGLLALRHVERRVLASMLVGDAVQADVARTTVSFTEPQVLAPAIDEATARTELLGRAFEYLAGRGMVRVISMRQERHALEKERALLQAQLQLARRRGAGFGRLGEAPVQGVEALQRDLDRVVEELEASASQALLPVLLDAIAQVLSRLEEHIVIEPATLALDAMNFSVDPLAAGAIRPQFATLRLAERGPYAALIARFPRAELRADTRFEDAAKYL